MIRKVCQVAEGFTWSDRPRHRLFPRNSGPVRPTNAPSHEFFSQRIRTSSWRNISRRSRVLPPFRGATSITRRSFAPWFISSPGIVGIAPLPAQCAPEKSLSRSRCGGQMADCLGLPRSNSIHFSKPIANREIFPARYSTASGIVLGEYSFTLPAETVPLSEPLLASLATVSITAQKPGLAPKRFALSCRYRLMQNSSPRRTRGEENFLAAQHSTRARSSSQRQSKTAGFQSRRLKAANLPVPIFRHSNASLSRK